MQAWWVRHQVLSAVRSAQSVRLEEFRGDVVLTQVELTAGQRAAVGAALPMVPDFGLPGVIPLCFSPHHRIIARDGSGAEFTFTVCFGCENAEIKQGPIFMTPWLWHASLRRLFTDHNIPIRSLSDYSKPVATNTPNTTPEPPATAP